MALIQALSPDEVVKEKEKKEAVPEVYLSPLVNRVYEDFRNAKMAKMEVEKRMIENIYAFKSEYTPEKLKSIREDVGGSEIYIPLTNIKCRAAKAWLSDIYFQGEEIFALEPTPIPDLPDTEEEKIRQQIEEERNMVLEKLAEINELTNGQFDISFIEDYFENRKVEVREEYLKRLREYAKERADFEFKRIKDQLVEGGFYSAFDAILHDITIFPTAILKGVIVRKEKRYIYKKGRYVIEEVVIPSYNRVSPFDIYPAPNASSVDEGYLIEVLHLTPEDLWSLSKLEDYDQEAIRDILSKYHGGRLSRLDANYESQRREEEGREYYNLGDTIDVIEYWGTLRGSELVDTNLQDIDEDEYYDVCLWVCDEKIIKAMLNPDPLGKKPYATVSFVRVQDSFWGLSIADILRPLQDGINALARATINNAVFSSGPIIERNKDRLASASDKSIHPYQIIDVHESAMNSAPAVRFNQPTNISQAVAVVMQLFQKMADEYSGIASYAHGDITVGGAGRTSSGLSMLMANATRGIKDVVRSIDTQLIEPLITRQFFFNLRYLIEYPDEVPDLNIRAKGTVNLLEKQAQATRMLEFLQLTSNPVDLQIVGPEGRKYLLEKIAKNVGLDVEEIFKNQEFKELLAPLIQAMQGMQAQQTSIGKTPENPVVEQAIQMGQEINQEKGANG